MLVVLPQQVGQGTHQAHLQAKEAMEALLPVLLYLQILGARVVAAQLRLVTMVNQTVTAVLAQPLLLPGHPYLTLVEVVAVLEH